MIALKGDGGIKKCLKVTEGLKNNPSVTFLKFPAQEVGEYFRNKKMSDIVKFTSESNEVSFIVTNKTYKYVLPIL